MALEISVPDAANSSQTISINAINVDLIFRWNVVSNSWSLDIYVENRPLRLGVAIESNRSFTSRYIDLTTTLGGFFYCERVSNDALSPLNYDSFTNGTHRIIFIPTVA